MMEDNWICEQCAFVNTPTLSMCSVCQAPRKRTTERVSPLSIANLSGYSVSDGRTRIQDSDALPFDTPKPVLLEDFICPPRGASGSPPLALSVKQQNKSKSNVMSTSLSASAQSKWTCSSCTYDNWPNASRCTMCKTLRRLTSAKARRCQQSGNGWHGATVNTFSAPNGGGRVTLPLSDQSTVTGRASAVSRTRGKAAAEKRTSVSPTRKWVCRICTFENWSKASRCVICRAVRSPIRSPVPDETHVSGRLSPCESPQSKNSPPLISPSDWSTRPSLASSEWEASQSTKDEKNERERTRQVRNCMNEADWLFLRACQGVVDNDIEPVVAYISTGGHLARQLTEDDVLVLERPSAFETGHTLVHLALRFKREEVLSAMLTPALADAHKRLPNHANEELACTVRKYMASCLRQRKGDWPCYFMTESTVFSLPLG